MPQPILPLFSEDMTIVNGYIGFQQKGNIVYWFQGQLPIFSHHTRDERKFRMICSEMINNNIVTSADLARSLNVNREKLSRWARQDKVSGEMKAEARKVSKKKRLY
jgi:hypothetical protein